MDTNDITLLVVYSIGVILNFVIFFIQRAEIKRLKNITEHVERYFKIFSVEEFEKLVKLKEESFETQKEVWLHKLKNKFTKDYMEKIGKPTMEKAQKELEKRLNDQFDEMGQLILDFLYNLPEDERENVLKDYLPLTTNIFREQLKAYDENESQKKEI
jgi:uncharacterized Fe-S cluster-containing radical SAM superfamily protein